MENKNRIVLVCQPILFPINATGFSINQTRHQKLQKITILILYYIATINIPKLLKNANKR